MSDTEHGTGAIRASDAEREAVIARLNTGYREGRLALDEFNERVGQAHQARTRGELDKLVADLPAPPTDGGASGQPSPRGRTEWFVSPLGGFKPRGRWRLDHDIVSITLVGGAHLDLREVEFAAQDVVFTKISAVGGIHVIVPPGVRVELEGFSLLGGRDVKVENMPPLGSPTLRVRAFSLVGGVDIRSA